MKLGKVLGAALMLSLAGCASFTGDQVAKTTLPSVSQYQQRPSVYVDFHFYQGEVGSTNEMPQARDMLKPQLESVLKESALFSRYTLDPFQKQPGDYTLRLNVYNHGSVGAATVAGMITGFSLFIIPSAAKDEYTMSLEVIDPNGQAVQPLRNEDYIRTWMGIWLLPMAGNTPNKAATDTFSRQFTALLKQAVERQALKYAAVPSPLLRG